nr:RNA-directed DNA polymerase, eukaryota, reverse transcriptase zinc-binding domain protein [Tanacetum cinerariifolium]
GLTPFKLFNSWFDHNGFDDMVKEVWNSYSTDVHGSIMSFHKKLRGLKSHLRLWYSRTKESEYSRKRNILLSLRTLDDKIDVGRANDEDIQLRVNKLLELEGYENSKFFHGINFKRKSQMINGILHEGEWITDPNDIKMAFLNFYKAKFSCHDSSMIFPPIVASKRLCDSDRSYFDSIVSLEEIKDANWDCGSQKAPGPDGFSHLSVKKYWDLFRHDIHNFVNGFFTSGTFPPGSNSSFFTLILKVPNPLYIKDFRPISLIGVHYKTIAKILANRLSKVINSISSHEQYAFISGRQILDGPFILSEVINWYKKRKKKMMLFKVDFEKSFDSFWNTASVKRSGDVTRLQALVDKKKVVLLENVIHEILQLDDADGVNQVGDLSTHTTRYISPALTQKVFANMRRVGKGFSGVETPLFEGILTARQLAEEGLAEAQKLEIIKLKVRVKRLEKANKVKSSKLRRLRKVGASRRIESSDDMEDVFNQGRMIDDMDKDKGIELDDSEVQEVVEIVTTAKLITNVVTAASQVSAASATISAAKPSIPAAASTVVAAYTRLRKGVIIRDPKEELSLKTPAETPKLKDKGKGIMVETLKPMKKKDQIELDAEYARKLHEEINRDHEEFKKDINWDAAIDHVNQKSKNPEYIKRYQGMKKRLQTESEARKNMMIYLKNTAGYKMDFFKGMMYAEICPIFQARFNENMRFLFKSREEMEEEDQEAIKSINETPAQKAAKRRKQNKEAQEAEDLRKRLEVVDNEDDDVFIEATPLARKLILLVERRYPLLRFTLEQLVNVTRLQVEEESEMSLELLRFKDNSFKNISKDDG